MVERERECVCVLCVGPLECDGHWLKCVAKGAGILIQGLTTAAIPFFHVRNLLVVSAACWSKESSDVARSREYDLDP